MDEVVLGVDEVEVDSNMYDLQEVTASEENQKKSASVDVAASTISQGGNLQEAMQSIENKTVGELDTEATTEFQNSQRQLLVDTIETNAAIDSPNLPALVANAPNVMSEIEAAGSSKLTPYLHWVNRLDGSEKLSLKERKSIATDAMLLRAISEGADKRGFWDNAWDVLGMMAVPDESYNAAEIQAQLFGDSAGFTEWLDSADAWSNIAGFRESLSAEERVLFDENLVEVIRGVDDNVVQQVSAVLGILGRDPESIAFQSLEKVDALLLGAGIGASLHRGLRSLNVMNRTAKSGDARTAAKIADAVASSIEVSRASGVSQADAAALGNPVKAEGVFTGAPDGLQTEYRRYSQGITEALNKATDTLGYVITPDTKDADEIAAAINRRLSKNDDLDNIKVTQGVEGIHIEYDVIDGDNISTVRESRFFTLDDLGGFVQKESGLVASILRLATSANTLAGADRKFFVQSAEALLFAKARMGKAYGEAVDAALKPVNGNKESLTKIDSLMKVLDGTDIDINYQTLVNEGVGGIRLTDKEFIAVKGLREVLDDAYNTNNNTLRREMELRGTKGVKLEGEIQYAKPYDEAEEAYTAFSTDAENMHIVDTNDTVKVGIGLDELKQAYKEGKVLVRNDSSNVQDWFTSPDGLVKYALVDKDQVTELPANVLGKIKNYLPKLREDANFFVKQKRNVVVNGVNKRLESTLAYAATESQAQRYIQKLQRVAMDAGEEFDLNNYTIKFDREVSKGVQGSDTISVNGGLIRGKRKSTELDWAGDLDEGGRTDTLDSLQRYMSITADRQVMSEWRLEARARIRNEASLHPDIGDKGMSEDWDGLRAVIDKSGMDLKAKAKLLSMYDQTSTLSNIPTKSDQKFQGAVRAIGKAFDRAGRENIAKYIYQMHDKSLVDVMKGATFNLTLGMFNLVQIPVQLFGASVAASINPIAAAKGAPRWLMASTLDFVTNEKSSRQFLRKMAKSLNLPEDALANDYAAWRKSGMYESVVRGNADASSLANRLPYDAGFLRRGFNRFVELGQTPYRMGELSNMRISFFTALENEKALMGKAFNYDDTTIARVVARAEQYRLNMSGGNKAAFQKGIWALPTQFKQIYTKYLEAVTGSHFTGQEKARLLVGQAALFGAAGVPIINYATDEVVDKVFGLTGLEADTEKLIAAKRGALGWLINHEYDMDALISGRLTVSADVVGDLQKAFFDEKTPMLATMLGPSYLIGDKSIDLFQNMIMVGGHVVDDMLEGEDLTPVAKEAAIILARSTAALASSSRKWMAAVDLTNGWVRKSDGMPLYSTQADLGDVYARAVGFGSQEMDDLYKLSQSNFKTKDKIRAYSTSYISILHDLHNAIDSGEEFQTEAAQRAASMLARQIQRLDPDVAKQVWTAVNRQITNPRDFKEQVIKEAIMNSIQDLTDSANKVSVEKQKFIEENNLE